MRATPPSRRMSAGTRSSAITAHAPAFSAITACSALTTSMITPPLSISARPLLTRMVPVSAMRGSVASCPLPRPRAAGGRSRGAGGRRRGRRVVAGRRRSRRGAASGSAAPALGARRQEEPGPAQREPQEQPEQRERPGRGRRGSGVVALVRSPTSPRQPRCRRPPSSRCPCPRSNEPISFMFMKAPTATQIASSQAEPRPESSDGLVAESPGT